MNCLEFMPTRLVIQQCFVSPDIKRCQYVIWGKVCLNWCMYKCVLSWIDVGKTFLTLPTTRHALSYCKQDRVQMLYRMRNRTDKQSAKVNQAPLIIKLIDTYSHIGTELKQSAGPSIVLVWSWLSNTLALPPGNLYLYPLEENTLI